MIIRIFAQSGDLCLLEGFRDVRISRLLMQQQIHRALALLVPLIKPNEVQRSINCFANV